MAGIKENKLNDEDVEQVNGGTYTLKQDDKGNYLCPDHKTALKKEWRKILGEVYVCNQCPAAYRLRYNHGSVFFERHQIG